MKEEELPQHLLDFWHKTMTSCYVEGKKILYAQSETCTRVLVDVLSEQCFLATLPLAKANKEHARHY